MKSLTLIYVAAKLFFQFSIKFMWGVLSFHMLWFIDPPGIYVITIK